MAKTCPACQAEISESSRRTSAWVPILTAVGVSAAAILVYKQVRRSRAGGNIESLLSHCARAANVLDRRVVDAPISLAS